MNNETNISPLRRSSVSRRSSKSVFLSRVPSPKEIVSYLDERVIGQADTKKRLAIAVHNHYQRVASQMKQSTIGEKYADVVIEKSNIILHGETGTGKTFLLRTIAEMLGVPFYIQDCTKLTASGYVGEDVENCLVGLLKTCNYDVELAQFGIVCLDEVDKIAKKGESVSTPRDVSGECVQQGLLKIVEGNIVGVMPQGGRKHPEQPLIDVDTTNILFIAMGAFVGLDKIVEKRLATAESRIGFPVKGRVESDTSSVDLNKQVTTVDLNRYGMIPEFIGRFPIITHTDPLTRKDLRRIVYEPKNSILRQYSKLFYLEGKELVFEPEAIDVVVDAAIKNQTGARGLRSIFETVLNDLMFEYVGGRKRKVLVTAQYASEMLKAG